jgi:hypothetical protein
VVDIAPASKDEVADIDAELKAASEALIAEMDELIQRAKILQAEHVAIVAGRRRLTKLP